jgi:hypothetical protein
MQWEGNIPTLPYATVFLSVEQITGFWITVPSHGESILEGWRYGTELFQGQKTSPFSIASLESRFITTLIQRERMVMR